MATIGVLLHVYHLGAKNWQQLVWGDPASDKFGSATQFACTLLGIPANHEVRSIIYSGPSAKDGLTEGAYTKQLLIDRIDRLSDFPSIKERLHNLTQPEVDVFERRIRGLVTGPVITNTLDEVRCAARYFREMGVTEAVYQIAAASHAPRCLQNQLLVRSSGAIPAHQPWYVISSDICFSGTEQKDVLILEPPHRGDDPMTGYTPTLGAAIQPYFAMNAEQKQQFIQAVRKSGLYSTTKKDPCK